MKIVDANSPKSKAQAFRETIKQIAGKNKAVVLKTDNDFRSFCKIVRKQGLKPISRKQDKGGWNVWVR